MGKRQDKEREEAKERLSSRLLSFPIWIRRVRGLSKGHCLFLLAACMEQDCRI